jgi:PIN domain nuclease of toxin-antitoxin system
MSQVLLDTHIWIWWLTGQSDLAPSERAALDRHAARTPPLVSAMSLWEAQMLHRKGRLQLATPFDRWIREASLAEVVEVVPITAEVVVALDALPRKFHGDPADRIIVASARSRNLPLYTRDLRIRRSRLVELWRPT